MPCGPANAELERRTVATSEPSKAATPMELAKRDRRANETIGIFISATSSVCLGEEGQTSTLGLHPQTPCQHSKKHETGMTRTKRADTRQNCEMISPKLRTGSPKRVLPDALARSRHALWAALRDSLGLISPPSRSQQPRVTAGEKSGHQRVVPVSSRGATQRGVVERESFVFRQPPDALVVVASKPDITNVTTSGKA